MNRGNEGASFYFIQNDKMSTLVHCIKFCIRNVIPRANTKTPTQSNILKTLWTIMLKF